MNGTPWNGAANPYYVPAGYATALFLGDPVTIVGDSNDAEVSAVGAGTFASGMLSEVNVTTLADGNVCTGAIVAVFPTTNASLPYKPASTEAIVMVADDPNIIFQIRDDGTTALTADSIGLNAIMESGTGSTYTGRSGYVLDTNTDPPAADASNMLTILNLARLQDNTLAASAVWDVRINQHTQAAGAVGVD